MVIKVEACFLTLQSCPFLHELSHNNMCIKILSALKPKNIFFFQFNIIMLLTKKMIYAFMFPEVYLRDLLREKAVNKG